MANSQAVSTSFKVEILNGIHAFGTSVVRAGTGADTFKALLVKATGTVAATQTNVGTPGSGAPSTSNIGTDEVSGTNYTSGGVTMTWVAPTSSGTTAYSTPSASFSWTTVTLATAFDCVVIYNSTQGNKTVAAYTFGSQTVTAGNFSLTMPVNDSSTGLLRLA